MSDDVTLWFQQLSDPKTREQAAGLLWMRYIDRLAVLVRQQLSPQLQQRVDASDVMQSVWKSFFDGRFDLANRNELWSLLARIAANKAADAARFHRAGRRDVRKEAVVDSEGLDRLPQHRPIAKSPARVRSEIGEAAPADEVVVCHVADGDVLVSLPVETLRTLLVDATPEHAVRVIELLESLPPELQQIAVWQLQSLTIDEIAQQMKCTTRTVNRRIQLIRQKLVRLAGTGEFEAS